MEEPAPFAAAQPEPTSLWTTAGIAAHRAVHVVGEMCAWRGADKWLHDVAFYEWVHPLDADALVKSGALHDEHRKDGDARIETLNPSS
eukprot:gene16787-12011_t